MGTIDRGKTSFDKRQGVCTLKEYFLIINIIVIVQVFRTTYGIINSERKRKKCGEIILEAETSFFKGDHILSLFLLFLIFYLLAKKYPTNFNMNLFTLLPLIILALATLIDLIYYGSLKKGIAQGGIIGENGVLQWKEIEDFDWGEKIFSKDTLILRVDRKKTLYQKYFLVQYLRLNILPEKKRDFEKVIKEKLRK